MANNINLNHFDVVVIESAGAESVTTCYKNYADYVKDKTLTEGCSDEPSIDLSGLRKLGE